MSAYTWRWRRWVRKGFGHASAYAWWRKEADRMVGLGHASAYAWWRRWMAKLGQREGDTQEKDDDGTRKRYTRKRKN